MTIHKYFTDLTKLERIERCPGNFVFERSNVAAHSFKVTIYAEMLGKFEELNGSVIDWTSLYRKAINHDTSEFLIGDIATPVKYATPAMREMVATVEDMLVSNYINKEIPLFLQDFFKEKMGEGKDETIEGYILAVADKLDQLYEAFNEMLRGNKSEEFPIMFKNALSSILDYQMVLPYGVKLIKDFVLKEMIKEDIEIISIERLVSEVYDK